MRTYPAYIGTHTSGALRNKARQALASLATCRVCPRRCSINRLSDDVGICKSGRYARVSSWFPHFGEEDCLRGWGGSGTIFFSNCNLRCVFCQNSDITHDGEGQIVTGEEIAAMMLDLQLRGCHNINLVTPSHVVPQILEALVIAVEGGLRLPLVYNTSAYDEVGSLRLLDDVVDLYMPDFKYWSPEPARRYLTAQEYAESAKSALKEMHRQVGDLVVDEQGLARRGLLVRHLLMPGGEAETREILKFLSEEISPDTHVNLMTQYRPAGKVRPDRYVELNRPIQADEHHRAVEFAGDLGLVQLGD